MLTCDFFSCNSAFIKSACVCGPLLCWFLLFCCGKQVFQGGKNAAGINTKGAAIRGGQTAARQRLWFLVRRYLGFVCWSIPPSPDFLNFLSIRVPRPRNHPRLVATLARVETATFPRFRCFASRARGASPFCRKRRAIWLARACSKAWRKVCCCYHMAVVESRWNAYARKPQTRQSSQPQQATSTSPKASRLGLLGETATPSGDCYIFI